MGSLWGAHFSKNSVSLEQNEIFQFCFQDSTSVEAPPPMGGWLGGLMGGLMGGVRSNH